MKPDLVCVWPRHVDYPLFRYYLKQYRDYFNMVYIALVRGLPDYDFSDFLVKNVKGVRFIKPRDYAGSEDWRDVAVKELLEYSKAEKVLFLEQDFLFTENIIHFLSVYDKPFLGFREGDRVHPSFALIERKYIEKTKKDFSANPPQWDHFGRFFRELSIFTEFKFLEDFSFEYRENFYHMNGLTQNYMCFKEKSPFYRADEFLTYNTLVSRVKVPQNPDFIGLCSKIESEFGKGEVKFLRKFFPKEVVQNGE